MLVEPPGDSLCCQAEEKFKELAEAYSILSSADKRKHYDFVTQIQIETQDFGGRGSSCWKSLKLAEEVGPNPKAQRACWK